jgi:hypothetical protein
MESSLVERNVNVRCLEILQIIAVELSLGCTAQAEKKINALKSFWGEAGAFIKSMSHSLIVWHAILTRRIDEALDGASFAVKNALHAGSQYALVLGMLCRALAFKEARKYRSAMRMIQIATKEARKAQFLQLEFTALLIKAEIEMTKGLKGKALATLGAALPLGRRRNYVNVWLWRSDAAVRLCLLALEAGLEKEYVIELIRSRRLFVDSLSLTTDSWPWAVKIRTLGDFQIRIDGRAGGKPVRLGKKPLAMLKLIVAMGPKGVQEHAIQDILWRAADGDAACNAYRTTLYRLRKAIGIKDAIATRGGMVYLDRRFVWVDAWVLEKLLDDAESVAERNPGLADRHRQALDHAEKALSMASGTFLAEDDTQCVAAMRGRLDRKITRWRGLVGTGAAEAGSKRHGQNPPEQV